MTLQEKVAYFDQSITHDQKAIAWIYKYRKAIVKLKHQDKINRTFSTEVFPSYGYQLRFHKRALRWHANLAYSYRQKMHRSLTVLQAIDYIFGPYASQARSVADCESGGTYSVYAHNGQYLGTFQMGSSERAKYGHSTIPYFQVLYAYHYFVDSGRDWSPWDCQP